VGFHGVFFTQNDDFQFMKSNPQFMD